MTVRRNRFLMKKNLQMHWISILLILRLYMFRAAFLFIIRGSWP